MTEPIYCVGCSEALSTDRFVKDVKCESDGFLSSSTVISYETYGVCLNVDCPRFGLMTLRVRAKPVGKKRQSASDGEEKGE